MKTNKRKNKCKPKFEQINATNTLHIPQLPGPVPNQNTAD